MKTKTLLTLGAVAVLGVLAYNYYKKQNNTSGYSNASGTGKTAQKGSCAICKNSSGTIYHTADDRNCNKGDSCLNRYA